MCFVSLNGWKMLELRVEQNKAFHLTIRNVTQDAHWEMQYSPL